MSDCAEVEGRAGVVADVIVSKLVDHLPLYRQEQHYAARVSQSHSVERVEQQ